MNSDQKKLSKQETIKAESGNLRGRIAQELDDPGLTTVSEESYELLKFHGTYEGYDRDTATQRKQQGLEKQYEFMLRLKMPAGRLTAAQYLIMDELSDKFANGTLRITSRQTFQFHCVLKENLKAHIAAVNRALLSTIAGCGDITRNIITCPAPIKDNIHATLEQAAYTLAKHLAPHASTYYDIWLDGERIESYPFINPPLPPGQDEPLYGKTYMPRKFKVAIGQPEDNCMDALTNDLALLALFNGQELVGYNLALGGGLGMNHNTPKTYPRLATPIAFVKPEDMVAATEAVVKLQRDYGDRSDRKHARLKYVVEENGIEWTRRTLEGYFGRRMQDPLPMPPFEVVDHLGWHEQGDGKWFLGVPISSGRIMDRPGESIRSGLRDVIRHYQMNVVLTLDQNLILCDIEESQKPVIERTLHEYGIKLKEDLTPVYRHFLACVALPTCGKALAEAERVKLPLVADIEKVMDRHGLLNDKLTIRIAGCPNACSRPYVGDIGIVGRTPGHYALFIGGDFEGTRLNEKIFDKVPFEYLPETLDPMFALYKSERLEGEGFGDYCLRVGVAKVKQAAVATLASHYKWAQ